MRLVTFDAGEGTRAGVLLGEEIVPVGASVRALLEEHDAAALAELGARAAANGERLPRGRVRLLAPVPDPEKIICLGLNYRDHAEEAGLPIPEQPMVFTKFPTCLAGPNASVPLTSDRVDWEVEQVVVIGREAHRVPAERAWDHVAGFCVGQDVSDRAQQFAGKPPQFSLGKSAPAFGPIGPALVSLDEIPDRNDMKLRCWIDGELVQDSSTKNLIFPVPVLIEHLARLCRLLPGDLIFTGTPAGVGSVRTPRRYLKPGETIVSEIDGVGRLSNRCVEAG